jgi:hypothetical protein
VGDAFEGWVFDEEFVRGGKHEPAADERVAPEVIVQRPVPGDPAPGPAPSWRSARRPGRERRLDRYGNPRPSVFRYLVFTLFYVLIAASLVRLGTDAPYASASVPSSASAAGSVGTVSASDPAVGLSSTTPAGTCFNSVFAVATQQPMSLLSLVPVPCSKAHSYELLSDYEVPGVGGAYPANDFWGSSVLTACRTALRSYAGTQATSLAADGTVAAYFQPDQDSWRDGDRTVYCVAWSTPPQDESVRAS